MSDIVETLRCMHRLSQAWSDSDVLLDAIENLAAAALLEMLRRFLSEGKISPNAAREILGLAQVA